MEWANLKMRYAVYCGTWPEWVDLIELPQWVDIDRLTVQLSHAVQGSTARRLKRGERIKT